MVAAYAQGVFDGKPHDFYQTFAFTFGFGLLLAHAQNHGKDMLDTEQVKDIAYKVYDETVRAFRGMDPRFVGVNDLALGSYYPGFVKATELFDPGGQGNYL